MINVNHFCFPLKAYLHFYIYSFVKVRNNGAGSRSPFDYCVKVRKAPSNFSFRRYSINRSSRGVRSSQPSKKLILALVEGRYGSSSSDTKRMRLQATPSMTFDLYKRNIYRPIYLTCLSNGLLSWMYLLAIEDTSMATLSPSLISTLSSN
jgi:hypothetical protein